MLGTCLYDPRNIGTGLLEDGIDIVTARLRLIGNAPLDEFTILVARDLTRDVELGAHGDGLALLCCISSGPSFFLPLLARPNRRRAVVFECELEHVVYVHKARQLLLVSTQFLHHEQQQQPLKNVQRKKEGEEEEDVLGKAFVVEIFLSSDMFLACPGTCPACPKILKEGGVSVLVVVTAGVV